MKNVVLSFVAVMTVLIVLAARMGERSAQASRADDVTGEDEIDPFAVAGTDRDTVSSVLQAVQDAVRADAPARVAEFVEFPLRVNGDGSFRMIPDAATFISEYQGVFTERIRRALEAQRVDELFTSWRGVMVGDGEVWFGAVCDSDIGAGDSEHVRFRIIAVNL
ncbi:MAG: hypothetical protein IPH13_15250 [Planctomycetes bacterium]|nr:hypothetical protein [Planctomycetota bacterium]MCC7172128.1 hypothetical protein [Planctomycetota bacterium]